MSEEKKSFEEKLQDVQEIISRIEEGMKTLSALDEELKDMNRRLTVLQDGGEQPLNAPGEEA